MSESFLTREMFESLPPNQRQAAIAAGLFDPASLKSGGMLTGTPTGPEINLGEGSDYYAYKKRLEAEDMMRRLMIQKEIEKSRPINKIKQYYEQQKGMLSDYMNQMLR